MHHDNDLELTSGKRVVQVRPRLESVTPTALPRQTTCFFEADPAARLVPRIFAEGMGTLFLMMSIMGSGLVTQRFPHSNALLGLTVSAVAIAGTLASLIVAFGAVSGGHFNPLITCLQWLGRERGSSCTAAYVLAQIIGGLLGAFLASVIFSNTPSRTIAESPNFTLLASETLASAGLMIIVFGCARSQQTETGPFAVAAWLAGAILASPSGSYANPAVTLASIASLGPTHLTVVTAISYVGVEVLGALLALAIILLIYPQLPKGLEAHDRPNSP
jgi:glycerol uptake facilitator-like aquaporin